MHIKDAASDGKVKPAGCGIGHVGEILRMYMAQGGNHVTIEPHLFDFSSLASLERNGQRTRLDEGQYATPDEAFDAAANALQLLLSANNKEAHV